MRAFIALALAALVIVPAEAAVSAIYKCQDRNGAVLYTDEACKGGQRIDVRPGAADPAAIARLERAQEAFDKRAADREAAEERIAARRQALDRQREAEEAQQRAAESAGVYGVYQPDYYALDWGSQRPFVHARPLRHRPFKLLKPHRFAPNPPFLVPRQ